MLGAGHPRFTVGARQHHPVQGGEEGEEASEGEERERRRVQRKGLCGDQARAFVFRVFSQLDLKVSSLSSSVVGLIKPRGPMEVKLFFHKFKELSTTWDQI